MLVNKLSKPSLCGLVLFAGAALSACATQPEHVSDGPGMVLGLAHGAMAILALLASTVTSVRIYAFPNNGFSYDLGFCIGFATSLIVPVLSLLPRIGGWLTSKS